jgi:hypothetical protein
MIHSFQDGQATIHFVDHSLVRVLCHRDLNHGTRVLPGPLDLPTVNRPTTNGTNTATLLVHNPLTSHLSRYVTALVMKNCETYHYRLYC